MRAFAIFLILVLAPARAHAGRFKDWCARNLVADDPYQYEEYATAWVERRIDQLKIRQVWGRATPEELSMLRLLEAEMRRREMLRRLVAQDMPLAAPDITTPTIGEQDVEQDETAPERRGEDTDPVDGHEPAAADLS